MSNSPYVIDVTVENFAQVVLQGSMQYPVLVDFWASWCAPCKTLMPMLEKLANEYGGKFILAKVNADEQQEVAGQLGVRNLPTVKLFKNGRPVDEFTGALPEGQIRDFIDRHMTRPSDAHLMAAQQYMQQGQIEAAAQELVHGLQLEPGRPALIVGLAQIYAHIGKADDAEDLIKSLPQEEQDKEEVVALMAQLQFAREANDLPEETEMLAAIEANPADLEARYNLSVVMLNQGRYEEAMDQLLAIMQKDRSFKEDIGRTTLLKIFDMLGSQPVVSQYRRRMFNMMHV